jgi:DNA end-binding protein Ku
MAHVEAPALPAKSGKLVSMPPARSAPAPPPVEVVERVRHAALPQEDDEQPLERSQIVKGYEYEKDRYVVFDEEELKRLVPETGREMRILEFVRLADIDPIFYESSYYAAPDRGGERSYALLLEALRKSGYIGLAEVAMQRREHIVVIRPGRTGIIMHTMFYVNETHAEDEYRTDTAGVAQRELELAQMLIDNLAAPFEPGKYRDKYKERVEELIAAKLEGREIAQAPAAPPAPVNDILAALQQSLASTAAKKPVESASEAPKKPSKPRTRRSSG